MSTVAIGFENEGVVKKLPQLRAPISDKSPCFDLFQNIQHIIHLSQLQYSFYWIWDSQDNMTYMSCPETNT